MKYITLFFKEFSYYRFGYAEHLFNEKILNGKINIGISILFIINDCLSI